MVPHKDQNKDTETNETPDQRKMNDLWRLLLVGASKEDAKKIMTPEDFVLFEQIYAEFDADMALREDQSTSSINFVIDDHRIAFKDHINKRKLRPVIHCR